MLVLPCWCCLVGAALLVLPCLGRYWLNISGDNKSVSISAAAVYWIYSQLDSYCVDVQIACQIRSITNAARKVSINHLSLKKGILQIPPALGQTQQFIEAGSRPTLASRSPWEHSWGFSESFERMVSKSLRRLSKSLRRLSKVLCCRCRFCLKYHKRIAWKLSQLFNDYVTYSHDARCFTHPLSCPPDSSFIFHQRFNDSFNSTATPLSSLIPIHRLEKLFSFSLIHLLSLLTDSTVFYHILSSPFVFFHILSYSFGSYSFIFFYILSRSFAFFHILSYFFFVFFWILWDSWKQSERRQVASIRLTMATFRSLNTTR